MALAATAVVPRVRIDITPLSEAGWYSWTVAMSADAEFSATWVMRSVKSVNGNIQLTPYRALVDSAELGKEFDPEQWVALDACALHGAATAAGLKVKADLATCMILIPGSAPVPPCCRWTSSTMASGCACASMPIRRAGRRPIEARRLRWFTGWAAINGAGANAKVESSDWHMNRGIRIGNEGGRAQLAGATASRPATRCRSSA